MSEQSLPPAELIHRMWRRKFWVTGILLTCVAMGFGYLLVATPRYEVEANLLLEPDSRLLQVGMKQADQRNIELTATQTEILSSRKVLHRAVEAYLIDQGYQLSAYPVPGVVDELTVRLSKSITVKPVVGTRILNVQLQWEDWREGQALAENLIDEYKHFLRELDEGDQNNALNVVAEAESRIREELGALQETYREACETSPLLGGADASWALQQSLIQQLGTAYTDVRSRRIGIENRLAALDFDLPNPKSPAQPSPEKRPRKDQVVTVSYAPDNLDATAKKLAESIRGWGALQMLSEVGSQEMREPVAIRQELFAAEVRREELITRFHRKHPEVIAVENQIAEWQQRLQDLMDRAPLELERALKTDTLQEARLRNLYDEELQKAKELDQQRLELVHLQKQIEQVEAVHNSMVVKLQQLELARDSADENGANLRITTLRRPTPNEDRSWPDKKVVLAGSFLIGLLGSSMLAFIPVARPATSH